MLQWWSHLTAFEQIFWWIALPATAVFLGQMCLTFFGVDSHHDLSVQDATFDTPDDVAGFHLLTLRNIIIFFTGFGWAGIFGVNAGFNNYLTTFLAAIVGLFLMFMVAAIYYFLNRLTESGTMNINNAVDTIGTVYLPVPERRTGKGQIQIVVQGATRELEAVTDGAFLGTGETVRVTAVINNQFVVVQKVD